MGVELLQAPTPQRELVRKATRPNVGSAADTLQQQGRALASYSLVSGWRQGWAEGEAARFFADQRMLPPVFH